MNDANLHPASLPEDELLRKCDIKRTRGSGPGGQHRNKVETAIVITHRPTGIIGQASERRSQNENRRIAIVRLRLNLAVGFRTELNWGEESFRPSNLWKSRVKNDRISVAAQHEDFPIVLAEAMDVLAAVQWNVATASVSLSCSSSQLIKLLKKEPTAFFHLNRMRIELGASAYR